MAGGGCVLERALGDIGVVVGDLQRVLGHGIDFRVFDSGGFPELLHRP
jgi:hypothetical protein